MKRLFSTFALFSIIALGNHAITIDEVLNTIFANNLGIKAQKAIAESEKSNRNSTTGLRNDPAIDGEYLFGNEQNNDKWAVSISQGFNWPGFYSAQTKAVKSANEATNLLVNANILETMMNARQLCIDIVTLNRKKAFMIGQMERYTKMLNNNEKAFNQGEVTILDTNKFRIEYLNAKLDADAIEMELNKKINELVGLNAGIEIDRAELHAMTEYPQSSLLPLNDYLQLMASSDPNLQYYATSHEAATHAITAAKRERLPGFTLGYKYSKESGKPFQGPVFGVNLPVFSTRGKVTAAKADAYAAQLQQEKFETERTTEITNDHARATMLKEMIESYHQALDSSNYTALLEKAFNGGQMTALEFLMELQYYYNSVFELTDFEHEYFSIENSLNRYQLLK